MERYLIFFQMMLYYYSEVSCAVIILNENLQPICQKKDLNLFMDKSSIAIIIPSYEPTAKLPALMKSLRKILPNQIIIVDDGSDPEKYGSFFKEAASVENTTLLRLEENKGKGCALKTAFSYCLEHDIPGVVTADSDGQHLPEDISRCMDALIESPDALILGCRDFQQKNVPFKSKFGNTLTCSIFRMLTDRNLSDTQTGLRGISADFMRFLVGVPGERFEYETQMLWEAKVKNIPYKEVKITTVYENNNAETHFRPVQDSWMIYKILLGGSFLQFIFFTCSSLISFLVDIGLFSLFRYVIFKGNQGGNLFFSVALARCVSAFVNYLLNRNAVFKKSGGHIDMKSLGKYIVLSIFIMLASFGITRGALLLFKDCNEVILKVSGDIILFCASFIIQKFFIFRAAKR